MAVIGSEADTPAKFLKAVALDPRLPLGDRVDAAFKAAPYFDRKQPTALDAGPDPTNPGGPGLPLFDPAKLSGLSTEELKALRTLLAKAGGAA